MQRIALIGIIVSDKNSVTKLNEILSQFSEYIIGRMGLPHKGKNISIISIVIEAENNIISSLSGKLGMLQGVSVKTIYHKEEK
ncbi:MAG: TM1266 family iron-only hydrogenase system putative regulator [Erysipelotrichaceae bacterium]|jgi:putative iron-only hydrogenase system regulator